MKKSYILFTVGSAFLLSLLSGCNLINPSEPVPSYIHIEKVGFTTDYTSQGTSSAKISDVWVYIDGQLQGAYELPVTFPVLKQGTHEVIVKAGIKVNGIAATRAPYPYYTQYSAPVTLVPGEIVTMSPAVTYTSNVVFPWKEDFETGAGTLVPKPGGSDTSVVPIQIPTGTTSPDVFEGVGAAAGYLDSRRTFLEFICNPSVELPHGAKDVFLEFNYKCNFAFTVGLYAHSTSSSVQYSVLNFRPSATWNKAYLYLTPTISATVDAYDYTVFFGMDNASARDSVAFVLDNIKVVTSN